MATSVQIGNRVEEIELLDLFPPSEGEINQIYGRVGQGKTYAATADILQRLYRGEVVYCNWRINFEGFDERYSPLHVFASIFGFKKTFYKFNKDNLRYIELDDNFIDRFEVLTDCAVYLDEGHVIFDSYQHNKFSMQKRKAILHTRHFNRTIVIISQRPTAIHVSARGNVNRFFQCEKIWNIGFTLFRKTEYQDMASETVDEEKPLSTKLYFASRRIYNSYNSKYLRGGIEKSQNVHFEAYRIPYLMRWVVLFAMISDLFPKLGPKKQEARFSAPESIEPVIKKSYLRNFDGVMRKQEVT